MRDDNHPLRCAEQDIVSRVTSARSPLRNTDREVVAALRCDEAGLLFVYSHGFGGGMTFNLLQLDEHLTLLGRIAMCPRMGEQFEKKIMYLESMNQLGAFIQFAACEDMEVADVIVHEDYRNRGYGQLLVQGVVIFYEANLGKIKTVLFCLETYTPSIALKCYRKAMQATGFNQQGPLVCTYVTFDPDVNEYDVLNLGPDDYETRGEARNGSKWTGEVIFVK